MNGREREEEVQCFFLRETVIKIYHSSVNISRLMSLAFFIFNFEYIDWIVDTYEKCIFNSCTAI